MLGAFEANDRVRRWIIRKNVRGVPAYRIAATETLIAEDLLGHFVIGYQPEAALIMSGNPLYPRQRFPDFQRREQRAYGHPWLVIMHPGLQGKGRNRVRQQVCAPVIIYATIIPNSKLVHSIKPTCRRAGCSAHNLQRPEQSPDPG